ncbi:UDP-glucosyltransferase 2-like [Eurosta solidaginis]|uniref:UDP-glucosyltransferase 2-like n=1 Tax=Eurosta solidaginis TaxID=178769 RepID=UPI003530FBBF
MYSNTFVGVLLALAMLLTQILTTNGAKILAVYAFPGRSHYMMHRVIIKELVKHGHEVTMITAQTLKPLNLGTNYTEILIEPEFDFWAKIYETAGASSMYDFTENGSYLIQVLIHFIVVSTEYALQQPNVQAIINAQQTKGVYDLLIVEQLCQEAFLALSHIYDVPVISTCTFAQAPYMSQMFGFISPLSYVPFNFMPFTDHMTFWERVENTYYTLKFDLDREYRYFPGMDELVKKYFGHLSIDFPTTSAMSRNLSAMLINNYTPLVLPGPKMENMVNVGGMHIYPNKSLPNDIQKFLDEAEHGAICFNLGTHVLAKELPQEKLQIFLDVFRNIKQRVLWKFENDSLLTNVPNNVMIKSWMPQNDILPHPNLRAFISHGGLFSSQEAVHYGVPVVGIPFMSDQYSKIFVGVLLELAMLLTQISTTNGAKILAVYAFPGRSHYMMHRVIIKELVKHGHEVTMITAQTLKSLNLGTNYTEILIEPEFDYRAKICETTGTSSMYEFTAKGSYFMQVLIHFIVASTEYALQQPNVQAIINAKQTKGVYDLLLVEQLCQEAFLALSHVYDVPVISTCTFAQAPYMSQMFGFISPLSYVPYKLLPLSDRMNFWERVMNTYFSVYMDIDHEIRLYPEMDVFVKKYFGHLNIDFPTTSDMVRNLSAILINNYIPLEYPAPKMDNMINVGGMHIYPNKPLPSDLQKFLDEAEHGAIYFSLGTYVQAEDLPQEKIQIFIDVFRELKQRVLWKFENVSLENVPQNVLIKTWMPQNDILAHPNIRAFVSHGGLFGTQEAFYYGIPIIGIPFFADQFLNVNRGELGGYTIPLDIQTLTRDDLKNAINEILYNSTYRDTMQRMSKIFRDRLMGPRETAIYWIEYVIRHKGARHMRAAGLDLKWYQFYLLDVIAFFVFAAAVTLGIAFMLVSWLWRRFRSIKNKQKIQ